MSDSVLKTLHKRVEDKNQTHQHFLTKLTKRLKNRKLIFSKEKNTFKRKLKYYFNIALFVGDTTLIQLGHLENCDKYGSMFHLEISGLTQTKFDRLINLILFDSN